MVERIIVKQHQAVRRVIDSLRMGRPLRSFITRRSELAMRAQALIQPNEARAFQKALLRLHHLAVPIDKLIVPKKLSELQNRKLFQQLSRTGNLFQQISEGGILDLRTAGLKMKLGHIDRSPSFNPLTIEDYREILAQHVGEFRRDSELANLFLYKALLRARIDLYRAGEQRSAQKAKGKPVRMTPAIQRVKDFLDLIANDFPFGTTTERTVIKDGFEIASLMLSKLNNTAANTALAARTGALGKMLDRQMLERVTGARRQRGWKIKYQGSGIWVIAQTGYRKTSTGILRKKVVRNHVPTAKILSMLQHEIDSITCELGKNYKTLMKLALIKHSFPENWDTLFEINLEFANYRSLIKEKAGIEIEGALELASVRNPNEQPIRLAKALLALAEMDIEQRQEELIAQRERFVVLAKQTEDKIGKQLDKFVDSIGQALTNQETTRQPAVLEKIGQRLGGALGTIFQGEMREPWLAKAKSRVVGLKKGLADVVKLVSRKEELINEVNLERVRFLRDEIPRTEAISKVQQHLTDISQLNDQIISRISRGAEYFMVNEAKVDLIRSWANDLVRVRSRQGDTVLGEVLRADAQAMGLENIEEIT